MRWAYDLCGAEPIIKDCPVYDATNLANGELLMKGATTAGTADGGVSLITAYSGTAGNQGVDAAGILTELTYNDTSTAVTPSSTFAATAGVRLGKVIINPFAVYRAEYGQLAADDVAVEASSTTTVIQETIATADEAIGAYIYFTHSSGTTSANRGSLRLVTDNTTANATIAALPTTPATTDQYIVIQPAHQYLAGGLDSTATKLSSAGTTLTNAMSNATGNNFRIVESFMEGAGFGYVALHGYKDRDTNLTLGALDGLPSDTKFYSDFVCKDHMFGCQEA